ncbi:MAG: hypothetical protein HY225_01095 [Candidatus Vogelbacteria bacterium]|nr:hypothetical protein [Candidatus Vogelbacteria bacterium]
MNKVYGKIKLFFSILYITVWVLYHYLGEKILEFLGRIEDKLFHTKSPVDALTLIDESIKNAAADKWSIIRKALPTGDFNLYFNIDPSLPRGLVGSRGRGFDLGNGYRAWACLHSGDSRTYEFNLDIFTGHYDYNSCGSGIRSSGDNKTIYSLKADIYTPKGFKKIKHKLLCRPTHNVTIQFDQSAPWNEILSEIKS